MTLTRLFIILVCSLTALEAGGKVYDYLKYPERFKIKGKGHFSYFDTHATGERVVHPPTPLRSAQGHKWNPIKSPSILRSEGPEGWRLRRQGPQKTPGKPGDVRQKARRIRPDGFANALWRKCESSASGMSP